MLHVDVGAGTQVALQLAHPHLAIGGILLVDDTNWQEPYDATLGFLNSHRENYKVVLDQKTAENGHPTFWNGIMALLRVR